MTDYEKTAILEPIETACVITKDGKVYKCFGSEMNVYPNFDLGDKLKGAIVSHNHPIDNTEYSFSNDDVALFRDYNLQVLRGCDEKYTYELTRDAAEIDKEISYDDSFENCRHYFIARAAQKEGIGYRRWKNGEKDT